MTLSSPHGGYRYVNDGETVQCAFEGEPRNPNNGCVAWQGSYSVQTLGTFSVTVHKWSSLGSITGCDETVTILVGDETLAKPSWPNGCPAVTDCPRDMEYGWPPTDSYKYVGIEVVDECAIIDFSPGLLYL